MTTFVSSLLSVFLGLFIAQTLVRGNTAVRHKRFITIKKCYGELGCFAIDGDFADFKHRPIQVLPESRAKIDVTFLLFDRAQSVEGRLLKAGDVRLLNESAFLPNKPLKFIIHGFLEDSTATWIYNIRRDLLIREDANVIEVDWGKGSKPPYTQATANTRLVGAEVALLIKFLTRNTKLQMANIHLIGHSLGAHVVGYAGKYFKNPKIGRITGLDPAGPYFDGTKPAVRIDSGDGEFVDVLHSNAGSIFKASYGIEEAVGQVDVYLNGGRKQPGCSVKDSIANMRDKGVVETVACSHMRIVHYFRASILSHCPFMAFRCADYDAFKSGDCLNCTMPGACIPVGLNATKSSLAKYPPGTKYFLNTGSRAPYCGYHYGIEIRFSSSANRCGGKFYVGLNNRLGDTSNKLTLPHTDKWFDVGPLRTVGGVQFFTKDQGVFDSVSFKWERERRVTEPSSWLGSSTTNIDFIVIFDAQRQTSKKYCSQVKLKTGETHNFVSC